MLLVIPLDFPGDQFLHGPQRFENAEIEISAIDERTQHILIKRLILFCADDGARLDVGIALPIASMLLQVIFKCRKADRQRAAVAERPQPHVDAKDKSVHSGRRKPLDDALSCAQEIFFVGDRSRTVGRAGFGKQEH